MRGVGEIETESDFESDMSRDSDIRDIVTLCEKLADASRDALRLDRVGVFDAVAEKLVDGCSEEGVNEIDTDDDRDKVLLSDASRLDDF